MSINTFGDSSGSKLMSSLRWFIFRFGLVNKDLRFLVLADVIMFCLKLCHNVKILYEENKVVSLMNNFFALLIFPLHKLHLLIEKQNLRTLLKY